MALLILVWSSASPLLELAPPPPTAPPPLSLLCSLSALAAAADVASESALSRRRNDSLTRISLCHVGLASRCSRLPV